MKLIILSSMLVGLVAGCQTVSPPSALTDAREAVSAAEDADVDDVMPRTMELATRQLAEAEELWDQSRDASEDNDVARSSKLLDESVQAASTAKQAADTGVRVTDNLESWDASPGLFAQMEYRANEAERLASENQQYQQNQTIAAPRQAEPKVIGEMLVSAVPIVYFGTGKANIEGNYSENMQQLAEFLKKHPDATVELTGYADPRGDEESNNKLAEQRAQTVADKLAEHGVDESKVQVKSGGEAKGNDSQDIAKLQLDRKVTVKLNQEQVAH